jgi:uncharacterized protein (UPF0332 family)
VNTADFLAFAEKASAPIELQEARDRSAASRAYYAAMLDARDRLRGVPHAKRQVDRKNRTHETVINCLRYGGGNLPTIGRALFSLKRDRERADYDTTRTFSSSDANEVVTIAKRICRLLDAHQNDLALAADESGSPPR